MLTTATRNRYTFDNSFWQEQRMDAQRYRVERRGAAVDRARGAMILIHGRGASAEDILSLAEYYKRDDMLYLAPQAPSGQWYPFRFTEPIARNEPGITLGMEMIDGLLAGLQQDGLGADRVVILGFSQGACLALEYAARHARRYGGVVGLSGGLIGPDGTPRDYTGSLAGTPIFLGCSDVDPHIPLRRVDESAEVFERMGGQVDKRIYPGMPHTVNEDELTYVRQLLVSLVDTNQ
jgi:predicted esterase